MTVKELEVFVFIFAAIERGYDMVNLKYVSLAEAQATPGTYAFLFLKQCCFSSGHMGVVPHSGTPVN